ncbi:hypothetical protein [Metabacillus sp. FJAT-52054]|uniref:Copper amine oxidase-like N-terminal domain-containing protein n=1 Tax=Metabacillus sediminis TaxID=3117746 RepID=A0ABZ2NP89_9BACI
MKKKGVLVLVSVLVLSMLFVSTGYAKSVTKKISAVFGAYVIKVNGKQQKTETLASGSKVYIPITEVSKLTDASVSRSGKTYNVKSVKGDLKTWVKLMDYYKRLDSSLEGHYMIGDFMDRAYIDIRDNNSLKELDNVIDKYNFLVKINNNYNYEMNGLIKTLAAQGYNMRAEESQITAVLDDYEGSLKNLAGALASLEKYAQTGDERLIDQHYAQLNKAYDFSFSGREKSFKRYNYYLTVISKK